MPIEIHVKIQSESISESIDRLGVILSFLETGMKLKSSKAGNLKGKRKINFENR